MKEQGTTSPQQVVRNFKETRSCYALSTKLRPTSCLTARQKTAHMGCKKAKATTEAAFMKTHTPPQLRLDQAQEFQSLENPAPAVTKFIAES